jgi:hypothetical protein
VIVQNRGLAWVAGAFLFCPCHLPLTLAVAGAVLSGTAAGVALRAHPYLAGAIITAVWAAGTWRGFYLLRQAEKGCEVR